MNGGTLNPNDISQEDEQRMGDKLQQLQIRDSLRVYNAVVERCFNDCVDNFSRHTLGKQEESCVRRCAEKFFKHTVRVGMRFGELNEGKATKD